MKNQFLVLTAAVISSLITSPVKADQDQNLSLKIMQKPGYQQDATVSSACRELDVELKSRVQKFLQASQGTMNEAQLNAAMVYAVKRNPYGHGQNMEFIHTCTLQLRLTNDAKKIAVSSSEMRYSGSGRRQACEELKASIDQDASVLYSDIDSALFSCGVSPIVQIQ